MKEKKNKAVIMNGRKIFPFKNHFTEKKKVNQLVQICVYYCNSVCHIVIKITCSMLSENKDTKDKANELFYDGI